MMEVYILEQHTEGCQSILLGLFISKEVADIFIAMELDGIPPLCDWSKICDMYESPGYGNYTLYKMKVITEFP